MKLSLACITITNKHYTLSDRPSKRCRSRCRWRRRSNTSCKKDRIFILLFTCRVVVAFDVSLSNLTIFRQRNPDVVVTVLKIAARITITNKHYTLSLQKVRSTKDDDGDDAGSEDGILHASHWRTAKHRADLNKALEDSLENPSQNEQHDKKEKEKDITEAELLAESMRLADFFDFGEDTEGSSSPQKLAFPKIPPSYSPQKQKAKLGLLPIASSSKGPDEQEASDPLARPKKLSNIAINAYEQGNYFDRLWMDYSDAPNPIHITLHIPGGGCVARIFVKSDTLEDVYGYLRLLGLGEYASESCRLATKSPRRCYSIEDGSSTLDELGLGNGGDLYLEKKK
ncbi:hypothetical protein GmHk_03G006344 [Glycine max]|nr:hypothetical protein GmHk_03G006344 [Glycine max]